MKMSFSEALVLIRRGHRMQREGWNGKGMFVFLASGVTSPQPMQPFLVMWTSQGSFGSFVPWTASQSDLLSDDWCLFV